MAFGFARFAIAFNGKGCAYWLGDYHTAGAFVRKTGQKVGQGPFILDTQITRYDYYPMWIEADNLVHYTRVEYTVNPNLLTKTPLAKVEPVKLLTVPNERWKPEPPPVDLMRIARPSLDVIREDNVRQQKIPRQTVIGNPRQ